MSFNADKCFTLHITRKPKRVEYNYMLIDHKLEVHNRAARFVNNNFYDREPGSVKAMISNLGWESLEQRPEPY